MSKRKILIVDDERPTREAMARILSRSYECLTAPDAEMAMKLVEENGDIVVLLTDYKMPGDNGVELIKKAKAKIPALGAILITAFGEISLAVEAMKQGADDFLTKPITDIDQLECRVAQAVKDVPGAGGLVIRDSCLVPGAGVGEKTASVQQQEGAGPRITNHESRITNHESRITNHEARSTFQNFTGGSAAMQRLYGLIAKVAPSDATVLVTGPSGSGKELAARAIHTLSRRADKPFVAVECSAFSGDLLKSELFGYEPGMFTGGLKEGKAGCFEEAAGGTLFLDEIGEIDMPTQTALLRTLETKAVRRIGSSFEKKVDFRLVAATNKDLPSMVVAGMFREDLFYRLNIIGIQMPALKEHREDIAPLARRFVGEFAKRNASAVKGIDAEALRALERYDWPGNVRQLRNVIERMVVLASGERLTVGDVPEEVVGDVPGDSCLVSRDSCLVPGAGVGEKTASVQQQGLGTASVQQQEGATLAESEKEQILAALAACHGNKSKAAEKLGISRRTIHRKLNEWNIA